MSAIIYNAEVTAGADREVRLGQLSALMAAVLWGTSWVTIAVALTDVQPLALSLLRGVIQACLLAAAIVFLIHRYPRLVGARVRWHLDRRQLLALAALGLLGGSFNVGQAFATDLAGPSVAALVGTQYPLIAALLAPTILGERLTRRRLAALTITSIGLVLLAMPMLGQSARLGGLLVAGLAAGAFGLYLVVSGPLMKRYRLPPLTPTLAVFVGAAVLSSPVLLAGGPLFAGVGIATSAALAWLVLGAGILPLALVEFAVRTTPTVRVTPYLFVTPIVGAVLGVWLLGDQLAAAQIAGAVLAVAGVALATSERDSLSDAPAVVA